MENGYLIIHELKSYGVEVKSLEETYDTSDPASVMLRAIKMAEQQMDNRRRAKNTQMGIRRALKVGRYACGAAPIGYSWDRNGTHPMIKPKKNAHLVKEAFELFLKTCLNIFLGTVREKEIDQFQKKLAELEPKLLKIDEMYVEGDLQKDSYQRMKASYKDEIQRLQAQISRLTSTDTNFMKYCRYGMSLLGNLDFHYQHSSLYIRKKLLGSIFTGKLVFENRNYRTTGLNEAVALISLFQKDLENKKAERLAISDKTFGNVPKTGIEPATCALRMREISKQSNINQSL
jgi:hypothetical protein